MSQPRYPFRIEKMTLDDIRGAVAIEQAAHLSSHPRRNFEYELEQNRLAHYLSLRVALPKSNLTRQIGVGGYWLIDKEAHIITIAVDPRWQRIGLGEWLLLNMLEHAQARGAKAATLEVRPSNKRAISLYRKYKFQEVGRRPAYYSDNGEDALILTTPAVDTPEYQNLLTTNKEELSLRLARFSVDQFTFNNRN